MIHAEAHLKVQVEIAFYSCITDPGNPLASLHPNSVSRLRAIRTDAERDTFRPFLGMEIPCLVAVRVDDPQGVVGVMGTGA